MVKSTIDEIKDITLERQIRKLAGVIDEQNKKIDASVDYSTDINNLKTSDAKQNTEINNLKTASDVHTIDIDNLKSSDINQTTQINNLKQSVAADKLATESAITALQSKDVEQDGIITNHNTQIQDITESLVSGIQIMSGTTTGDIKVRLERESAAAIDSNNYNLGLPVSAEIIQGTGPSMFKIQITMSSGIKVVSNDFVFTTEAIGNDVYISSFTFKAGNQSGYLSADIGLNNGVTIEANNFLVPTDPNVTSAIADLQTRLTTVENSGVTEISGLKTTVSEHTTAINELNTDVTNLMTDKADVNNNNQSITAGTINANNINKGGVAVATINDIPVVPDISGKVDIAQGTGNAGKVLGINTSGNVEPITIKSGEVWEEVDLNNFPIDWADGDRVKVAFFIVARPNPEPTSWSSSISNIDIKGYNEGHSDNERAIVEVTLKSNIALYYPQCPISFTEDNNCLICTKLYGVCGVERINGTSDSGQFKVFTIRATGFNGKSYTIKDLDLTTSNLSKYVYKMWRLKK